MSAAAGGEKEPENAVHANERLIETITKERAAQKIFTNYTVNPNTLTHITGKPNIAEPELDRTDPGAASQADKLIDTLRQAGDVPTNKYPYPLTESQEIGWDARHHKRNLKSVSHRPRQQTEITSYMDAAWKHEEMQKQAKMQGAP